MVNNLMNLNKDNSDSNSDKKKIRRNKKTYYSIERNNIFQQIYSLMNLDNDNAILLSNNKGKTGAATGKVWYNNGIDEKYFVIGQQPEGFSRGRLPKK